MKILMVHNRYREPGGEDVVFAQERKLLENAGHQVISYERNNEEIAAQSLPRQLASPIKMVWARDSRRDIAEILKSARPAVVHVHNTFMRISPSIYSACQEASIPVVQTLHNFRLLCPAATFFRNGSVCEDCLTSLWGGVSHACYRNSHTLTAAVAFMLAVHRERNTWTAGIDRFISLTNFASRKFVAGGLPAEKMSVKPNFLISDPGRKTSRGDFALFVGRLSPEKGLDTLLDAWALLKAPIQLQIIGDGPARAGMECRINGAGLSRVSLRGRMDHDGIIAAMKAARFLILPSKCYENFPMTAVEAFACGTPVICSRHGALEEIVTDGENGLAFTPGDAAALADRVEWAWNHGAEIEALGDAAREDYLNKYSAKENYAQLMAIYDLAFSAVA